MTRRQPRIKSAKITQAAKGEACTAVIAQVCSRDRDTVVAAHLGDSSGVARKADDLCVGFLCRACHDVMDGAAPWPGGWRGRGAPDWDFYARRANQRTLRRLHDLGILTIG